VALLVLRVILEIKDLQANQEIKDNLVWQELQVLVG
jgi:hypothetical protein